MLAANASSVTASKEQARSAAARAERAEGGDAHGGGFVAGAAVCRCSRFCSSASYRYSTSPFSPVAEMFSKRRPLIVPLPLSGFCGHKSLDMKMGCAFPIHCW